MHRPAQIVALLLCAACRQRDALPPSATPALTTPASPPRDPALWPFSSDSPWNTPLGAGAKYAPPGDPCTRDLIDPAGVPWINAATWSEPIYLADAQDAPVPIFLEEPDGKESPLLELRLPRGARPAGPETLDSDASLNIIDPGRRFVDELWHARPRLQGGFRVGGHSRSDLYGTGVGQGGERAYGGSAIGGLIREGELQAGIRHALVLALPREKIRPGFVWPARSEDTSGGEPYSGHVPIGQLVALAPDASFGLMPLSSAARVLAAALRDYGAYLADSSGGFALYAEPALEKELERLREELPRLRKHLRCVLGSRKDNVGGGGPRRAAPPPPLPPLPPSAPAPDQAAH